MACKFVDKEVELLLIELGSTCMLVGQQVVLGSHGAQAAVTRHSESDCDSLLKGVSFQSPGCQEVPKEHLH